MSKTEEISIRPLIFSLICVAVCLWCSASWIQSLFFQNHDQKNFLEGLGVNEDPLSRILEKNSFFQSLQILTEELDESLLQFKLLQETHDQLTHLNQKLESNSLPSAIHTYSHLEKLDSQN